MGVVVCLVFETDKTWVNVFGFHGTGHYRGDFIIVIIEYYNYKVVRTGMLYSRFPFSSYPFYFPFKFDAGNRLLLANFVERVEYHTHIRIMNPSHNLSQLISPEHKGGGGEYKFNITVAYASTAVSTFNHDDNFHERIR